MLGLLRSGRDRNLWFLVAFDGVKLRENIQYLQGF